MYSVAFHHAPLSLTQHQQCCHSTHRCVTLCSARVCPHVPPARLPRRSPPGVQHTRGRLRVQCSVTLQQRAKVNVDVQSTPNNSRRLFASVDINAPLEVVWQALTDYDRLADFIPGLTENTCLERRSNGARLLQVGAQDIAMGVKFSARVVLDIHEFIAGAPTGLCSEAHNEDKFPLPRGRAELGTPSDIAFTMVDGDFQAFQGVWRMQRCGGDGCCLSYALFVRPQVWLPVRLIQGRIKGEVASNLCAVREYAESMHNVASSDD